MKKYLSIILVMIILILMSIPVYAQSDFKAKVIINNGIEEVEEENLPTKKIQKVMIRILDGEYENEEYEMTYIITEDIKSNISNQELEKDDNILIQIEEKDGEINNITYIGIVNQNYALYGLGVILLIILLIIGINNGIMPVITYVITLLCTCFLLIFSMKMGWNLILVSSVLSFVITVLYIIRANGINSKTLIIILETIFSIAIAGILMNILFDNMGLKNINIKITDNFVNIKDLICSSIIVGSCGVCNAIILVKLNIDAYLNKSYKTKSDNIIEGQRSLKL